MLIVLCFFILRGEKEGGRNKNQGTPLTTIKITQPVTVKECSGRKIFTQWTFLGGFSAQMLRLTRHNFLFQQTAGNSVFRFSLFIVGDGVRLQEFIHHAAFCYIQLEEIILC